MKIWLDDIRPMPSNYTRWCKTADDAMLFIATGKVTDISLDHDLGPDEAGTGYDVAKYIEKMAHKGAIPPIKWSIHSANPVGRKNMTMALDSADRMWYK